MADIHSLVMNIADIQSVSLEELSTYFNNTSKEGNKNQDILEDLFVSIEDIKFEISEVRDSQLQLNNRLSSLEATLNKIHSKIEACQTGSSLNPIIVER